jgi:hypothetical protein
MHLGFEGSCEATSFCYKNGTAQEVPLQHECDGAQRRRVVLGRGLFRFRNRKNKNVATRLIGAINPTLTVSVDSQMLCHLTGA